MASVTSPTRKISAATAVRFFRNRRQASLPSDTPFTGAANALVAADVSTGVAAGVRVVGGGIVTGSAISLQIRRPEASGQRELAGDWRLLLGIQPYGEP